MNKNNKIIFATKHQSPHDSHPLPFYTFDTSFKSSLFVCFLNCTLRAVPLSPPPFSTTPPSVSLSVCLFSLLSSPSLFLSLRTGSLQHTQVIVLFGGPQFEEAGPAVVKFEGSTLGSHGVWEHCHYCVEVSWVVSIGLCSPSSHANPWACCCSWPMRPSTRTGPTASCSSSASLGLLQPLDLGTAQRQLVEELFSLWTCNPLWKVCHLEDSTHH